MAIIDTIKTAYNFLMGNTTNPVPLSLTNADRIAALQSIRQDYVDNCQLGIVKQIDDEIMLRSKATWLLYDQ